MKKFWLLLSSLILSIFIAGEALAQQAAKAELKVGFVPGPYIDEFKAGVEPELKKKGYAVRYFEFSTGLEANNAVFKGDIDANVMQHTVFLNSYNERQKTDLVGIVHVPTPPMGLYSKKHALGTPIKPDSTVAVPNDPVNLQPRSGSCATSAWSKSVTASRSMFLNSTSSRIPVVSRSCRWKQPRRRGRSMMSTSPPSRAISRSIAGLKLTGAFALEKMTTPYINVVAVKRDNAESPWAQDIVAAYKSPTFKTAILSDRFYDGFALPDYLR